MTLLGKIFIVLIFIMSILYMGFAVAVYATHKNWKEIVLRPQEQVDPNHALGLKFQLENQEKINRQLREENETVKNELNRERAARVHALAALESHYQQKLAEVTAMEARNTQLVQSERDAIEANAKAQENLTQLKQEVINLRGEIRTTQEDRDEQFKKVVQLVDNLGQAQGNLLRLESRRDELAATMGRMKVVLDKNGLNEFMDVSHIPPPLNGVVLAVEKDFVELSLGSDDGLLEGHQLEVFRDRNYLGRVVVRKSAPDRAVAEILNDFRKGPMQKGDRVATRTKVS